MRVCVHVSVCVCLCVCVFVCAYERMNECTNRSCTWYLGNPVCVRARTWLDTSPKNSRSFVPAFPKASTTIDSCVGVSVLSMLAAGPESSKRVLKWPTPVCKSSPCQHCVHDMREHMRPALVCMLLASPRSFRVEVVAGKKYDALSSTMCEPSHPGHSVYD